MNKKEMITPIEFLTSKGIKSNRDSISGAEMKELMKEYSTQLLKDYTERIIENAEIGTKKLLFDDPKEGDDAYMDYPIIDNQSIQNQLDKTLKELGL